MYFLYDIVFKIIMEFLQVGKTFWSEDNTLILGRRCSYDNEVLKTSQPNQEVAIY